MVQVKFESDGPRSRTIFLGKLLGLASLLIFILASQSVTYGLTHPDDFDTVLIVYHSLWGTGFVMLFMAQFLTVDILIGHLKISRERSNNAQTSIQAYKLRRMALWLERNRNVTNIVVLACAMQNFVFAAVPMLRTVVPSYQLPVLMVICPFIGAMFFGMVAPSYHPLPTAAKVDSARVGAVGHFTSSSGNLELRA